jgi:hypothetical protein
MLRSSSPAPALSRAASCIIPSAFDDHLPGVFAPAFARRHGVAFVLGMLQLREWSLGVPCLLFGLINNGG